MQRNGNAFECRACNQKYALHNNALFIVSGSTDKVINPLDKIKLLLKPFSRLYALLIKIVSPVYVGKTLSSFVKHNIFEGRLYLNLGSGNMRLHQDIINVDFIHYPNVDLVADISSIPLVNECCDGVYIIGVLEHVENPCTVIDEVHRLLKPGGFVYSFFPFMQGYHASPHDYFRTTHEGVKTLFKDFNDITIVLAGGPTSGFLWVLQEWLAMILSLGIRPLYYFWLIVLMCMTFPIKFIDIILLHHPMAANITSGFTIVAKK